MREAGSEGIERVFNNDCPLGTFFRHIGDTATYIARYDDLFNGKAEKINEIGRASCRERV